LRHKVLVVDDSAFMRRIITDLITEDPGFAVVGTARNGEEAVRKVRELAPDVVTLDVEMPLMDGLRALEIIMRECPVPIVMLSSLTDAGARETIRALELGAVDFVQKPSGSISLDLHKVQRELLDKLKAAVRARVPRAAEGAAESRPATAGGPEHRTGDRAGGREEGRPGVAAAGPHAAPDGAGGPVGRIAAIGTSTGGPRALQTVLSALSADFPAPILIVQHMPPVFTKSLADRLNALCAIRVREAEHGEALEPGTAYIAPGGRHMEAERAVGGRYRIRLTDDPPVNGHRPSVDVLFDSLVPLTELKRVAVIMTGMGADGARGLKRLLDSGAQTVAESEETCVVYGMPRAAVNLQAARHVARLHDIPGKLAELIREG
jgi:two-component system chemotaxis response regulator CheB